MGGKVHRRVVVLAKISLVLGLANRLILPRNVVRHEVDHHFHIVRVCATDQRLKFFHPTFDFDRQIGIDIVIISNGIGRSCPTLHHLRMLARNAESRVIGLCGVANNARQPNVRRAETADATKRGGIEVVELSTAIFLDATVVFPRRILVAEPSRK